jgi:hypothetical protein
MTPAEHHFPAVHVTRNLTDDQCQPFQNAKEKKGPKPERCAAEHAKANVKSGFLINYDLR